MMITFDHLHWLHISSQDNENNSITKNINIDSVLIPSKEVKDVNQTLD